MNWKHYSILFLTFCLASCANRGIGPQGGPKDSTPPQPVKSVPENGAVNFQGKRIEVLFNENLQLSDIGANMMMSPPQQNPPDVKARGKKLIVQFQDSLRDSTTYTIDFGRAVCDYTEKNPLPGYAFSFSTGPTIDTLEVFGCVYDAETLNPLKGISVGIYANLEDSAFTSEPFLRIAKTDSVGQYRIGNIRPGQYRLYAVEDVSRDYRLTLGEAMAYAEEIVDIQADTLPHFMPPLFLFKEHLPRLYLQRTLREKQHAITILFSSSPDSLPELRPLSDSLNYHITYSPHADTVTIWLTDSMSIKQDSLFIEARYRRTDSLSHLEWCTDTLRAIWRAPRMTDKQRAALLRKNKKRQLELKCNARQGFEVFDTLHITCSTPLASIDTAAIHVVEFTGPVTKPVPFSLFPTDTLPMTIGINVDWKPGVKYEVRLDSAALKDVYGVTHKPATYMLEIKNIEDYSTLRVILKPYLEHARLQLLSNRDKVLRELPASPEGTLFEYLKPDTYYLRLYIDADEDGQWTTGSWSEKRQPEQVYYFTTSISTKANWDFEEEWDYTATSQTQAKPVVLINATPKKK